MSILNEALEALPDTSKERHTLEAILISGLSAKEKINLTRACNELGVERSKLIRAFLEIGLRNYNNSRGAQGSGGLNIKKGI
ncbi:hypothetical protein [Variovorax sp. E3]|uniref:hypothetical protein n=1 Tax=Variovorax sp. E3 TaxID=1914993 RepID=UPI0018DCD82A|nr:hypothetical protein [Variovorax sp. E3]